MGYYAIVADRDTFISSHYNGGNVGACQLLDLYSSSAAYDDPNPIELDKTRILIHFSISGLESKIGSGKIPSPVTNASSSAYLKLTNCIHRHDEPYSFTVQIFPLIRTWDEGNKGDEDFSCTGYCNWDYAQRNVEWTTAGGDFDQALSASYYFSHEGETLFVDVTNIVNEWLDGSTAANGFLIKLTDTDESLSAIHIKKFFARHTATPNPPQLQVFYDDVIEDDREIAEFGTTANLYFYNYFQGQLKDLVTGATSGTFPGKVSISANADDVGISANLEATRVSEGKYKVSFVTPYDQMTATSFWDYWSLTAPFEYTVTSEFTALNPLSSTGVGYIDSRNLLISFFNLPEEMKNVVTYRVDISIVEDVQDRWINVPHAYSTDKITIRDVDWKLVVANTDEEVFSWQKASYDGKGNFVMVDAESLIPGMYYKILLKFDYKNEINFYEGKPFKVIE